MKYVTVAKKFSFPSYPLSGYPKIAALFPPRDREAYADKNTLSYSTRLDNLIRDELEGISWLLDELAGVIGVTFYQYDQLSLAETAMVREGDHHRISTHQEFRRHYQDTQTLEYSLLKPALECIARLLKIQLVDPDPDDAHATRAPTLLLEFTKRLEDIQKELKKKEKELLYFEGEMYSVPTNQNPYAVSSIFTFDSLFIRSFDKLYVSCFFWPFHTGDTL